MSLDKLTYSIKSRINHFDFVLFFAIISLICFGLVMVFSASSMISIEQNRSGFFYFNSQLLHVIAGVLIMLITGFIPYHLYRRLVYPILFLSLLLLILIFFPSIGHKAGGALRWLNMGFFRFQPSEFAKIALIIFISYSLAKKSNNIKAFSIGIIPHAIVAGIFVMLIMMQPDFGTSIIIVFILYVMLFISGVKFSHLMAGIILLLPYLCWVVISAPYRMQRMFTFLDPWKDPLGAGFQITHSMMAFASGSLMGAGLGSGKQKLFYLPEPHTDFIFAVIGEELGLIGVLSIIAFFLFLLCKGCLIAFHCEDGFGFLLAMGLTILLTFEAIINMAMVMGWLPTKGLPLPFISYGGTSIICNLFIIGILMNISMTWSLKRAA